MQFTKSFVTLALAASALAVPTWTAPPPSSAPQCCQNVKNSSEVDSKTLGIIAALLNIVVGDLNVPIGTGCTPVSVLGGVSCNTNTVTCGQVFARELLIYLSYHRTKLTTYYSPAYWYQLHPRHRQRLKRR
jgi:hypothetical protein